MTKKNFAQLEKKIARLIKILHDQKKICAYTKNFRTENYIQLIWKKKNFSKISKEGLNLPNSVNLKNNATHLAKICFSVN
jgi:hypothetical protein